MGRVTTTCYSIPCMMRVISPKAGARVSIMLVALTLRAVVFAQTSAPASQETSPSSTPAAPAAIPRTPRKSPPAFRPTYQPSVPVVSQPTTETVPAPGSQAAANQDPAETPIRVEVNEVIVPVTVTDEKGRFVSNLEKKDFEILDKGKPQTIRFFSRERSQPVVSGLLLDLSNSSRAQWKNFQTAATELALTLLPEKGKFSGYLIGYGNKAELMVNTTSDPEPFVSKIRDLKPGGGAALFDAIYMACTNRALVPGEPFEPRRVLIVIGDGNDNSSKKTLAEVLEVAQKNLVTIYGISTTSYGFTSDGDANLVKLAEETGGRVEYPLQNVYKDVSGFLSTPSDEGNLAFKAGSGGFASAIGSSIFRSIANVAGEVTTQYILRYIPNEPAASPNEFRDIVVRVSLPDVKVRARRGYFPTVP